MTCSLYVNNFFKECPILDAATRTRGYVTIDFDKTDALIKSANHR